MSRLTISFVTKCVATARDEVDVGRAGKMVLDGGKGGKGEGSTSACGEGGPSLHEE